MKDGGVSDSEPLFAAHTSVRRRGDLFGVVYNLRDVELRWRHDATFTPTPTATTTTAVSRYLTDLSDCRLRRTTAIHCEYNSKLAGEWGKGRQHCHGHDFEQRSIHCAGGCSPRNSESSFASGHFKVSIGRARSS